MKKRITLTLTPEIISNLRDTCPGHLSLSQHLEAVLWAATDNEESGVFEAKRRGYVNALPTSAIKMPEDYHDVVEQHWEPMND